MNHLLQTIDLVSLEHAAAYLSTALIAGLWQGIALALLAGLTLKFLPRTTATARFIIWTVVFAASTAMPFLHLAAASRLSANSSTHLLLDARWSYVLPAIWLAAGLFRLFVLVAEAIGLSEIWQTAEPIAEEVLQQAGLQAATAQRRVEVCTTSQVDRPSVIGFFAPRILIPTWLFGQLSDVELRHIVLHEMEHLRRRDDWLNLLQKIGLVLFPLNPAMFWIDRRLSTEREIACDDGVLARTNAPRAYASSLTSIAERRLVFNSPRRMVALALGALGAGALMRRRSEFATRIESILSACSGQRPASRPALAVLLVAGVLGGTAVMAHAPDLIAFGSAAAPTAASISSTPDRVLSGSRDFARSAKFETASYHVTTKPSVSRNRAKPSGLRSNAVPAVAVKLAGDRSIIEQRTAGPSSKRRPENQWMVLTSWEKTTERPNSASVADSEAGTDAVIPVSRVIVRTPDGRLFVAPYAAVPTQAGWLIVQL